MKPKSKAENTLLSAAACLTLAGAANAQSLIGDAYLANLFNDGDLFQGRSNVDRALLGPDAVGNWLRLVGYDVEHDTIEVRMLTNTSALAGRLFEFSDLDLLGGDPRSQIIGAQVISSAGAAWGQIDDSDISFTHDTVVIDGQVLSDAAWARNDFVRVGREFAPRASYTPGALDAFVRVPPSPFDYSVFSSVRDGPDSEETWPEFDAMGFDVEPSSIELFARRGDDGLAWPNGVSARFFLSRAIDPRFQVTGVTVGKALGFGWDQIDDSELGFSFHPECGTTVLSVNFAKIGGGPKDLNQSLLIALEQEVVGSLIGDGYVARLYLFGNPSPQESRQDTAREGGDMFGEWESSSAFRYNVEADEIVVRSAATSGSWASGVSFEFTALDLTPEGIEIIGATVTAGMRATTPISSSPPTASASTPARAGATRPRSISR